MRIVLLLVLLSICSVAINSQACTDAESGTLDVTPPLPPNGANYPPGTVVQMCFTLFEFDTPQANWFHAVIPSVGPGFDPSTLTPVSTPTSCAGTGSWGWYDSWTSCNSGVTFGPGFAFDGNQGLGCGGTANDGDPGNNWGDGGNLCPNRTFCWEVTTIPTNLTCNAEAYKTEVLVYGDGEAGSWGNDPCFNDAPLCWPEVTDATASVDMPCPGSPFTLTGTFDADANCGVQVSWTGPNGFTSDDLVTTAPFEGTYTLNVNLDGCTSFTVDVDASWTTFQPTLTPSPDATFCFGEQIVLTGGGADSYVFTDPNGNTYTTNPVVVTADPSLSGLWFMVATTAPDCQETLLTNITILPELMPTATVMPQPLCVGDDITLTGMGAGPGGTYTWGGSAPASNDNPHTFTVNAPGNYVATLTVTDAGGCTETIDVPYSVSQNPFVTINANPQASCEGDPVTITATGGGTYQWSSGQMTSSITVNPTVTTTYTVTVTSADGCTTEEDITIDVQPLLDPADISCETPDAGTIIWNWPDVPGADYYEVYIDGVLVETFFTGNSYEITGLDPLTTIEIRVVAYSNNNINCPGQDAILECTTPDCNPIEFFLETPLEQCYNPLNGPIELFVGVFGDDASDGSTVWTGPGFPIPTATPAVWFPPGPGTWTITATFTLFNGSCPYSEDFTFIINQAPSANFTAPNEVCVEEPFDVQIIGFPTPGATYDWDFAGATVISGNDAGPYTLSFPAAGVYDITLMTSFNGCDAMETRTVTVVDELEPPTIICQTVEDNRVVFFWEPVVGANGYLVDVLTGQSGTLSGTTYEVSGLSPGDSVTIVVTAQDDGPCPDVQSLAHTCVANQCPEVTVLIDTPADTFCFDSSGVTVALDLTVLTDSMVTDTFWSGPGVTGNVFSVDAAGPGDHEVTVTVFVADCPYDTSVFFTVLPLPTADFTATDTVCVNGPAILTYTGTADPASSTFTWDLDGGTILSGTDAGPLDVSWPSAGTYTVSLEVFDGNCASTLATQIIEVVDSLPPPVISCVNPQLDQVTFEWIIDPNATGYVVNHISGPMGTQVGNTYVVSGIDETDVVVIEVTALGDGPCGNSSATSFSCTPRVCEEFNVLISPPTIDSFCQENSGQFIVLEATVDGGLGTGTYGWTGNGMSNDTFFVDNANLGQNEIIVTYTEDGCSYRDTVFLTLIELPNANFTFDLSEVCVDSLVILTNEVASVPNSTYVWDFDGGVAIPGTGSGPHQISWTTPGTKLVTLSLTVNGCTASASATVEVIEPLPAPQLICESNDLNSTTVTWSPVEPNVGYAVSVNGGQDSIVSGTSFTATGLLPDEIVNISVRTLGTSPCGDSPTASIDCAAAPCPNLSADFSANISAICLDTMQDQSTTLVTTISGGAGGGTFAYFGPGVSGDVFDPAVAGVGTHTIVMTYVEAGPCSLTDSFDIEVFAEPLADFTLSTTDLCSDNFVVVTFNGTAAAGTIYNWDFDGGTILSGTGAGPYEISWATAGVYTISLSIDAPGNCSAVATPQQVTVSEPLADLNVICSESLLQAVTFSWPSVSGATSYVVTYAGTTDTISDLSFLIDSLLPEQTVSITVQALGPLPCGNGTPVTVECTTQPCPDITIDVQTAAQSFCLIDAPTAIDLLASSSGGDMTGTFTWSGPGVTEDNGNYSFDPAIAGAGTHTLTVDYVETGGCSATSSLLLEVFDGPFASIDLAASPICRTASTTVSYVGSDLGTASFDWDFAGATVTDLGNESYELSWPTAGTYQVILGVSLNGCFTADTVAVEVTEPLVAPQPFCDTVELTRIVFSWAVVPGATGYEVSVNNGPSSVQTATSLVVDNLSESETVSISVIALGPAPCGNSEAGTVSCTTDPCPAVTLLPSAEQTSFCTAAGDAPVLLEYSANGGFGNGTATWSGTGVTDNGNGNYSFDPTGLTPGIYPLVLSYTEVICPFSTTLEMEVFATPQASLNASTATLCSNGALIINFNGTAGSMANYDWDFGGATVIDLGNQTYELRWDNAGTYNVGLVISQNGCSDTTAFALEVNEPPTAGQQFQPIEVCANSGDVVDLNTLLTAADAGGSWSAGIGAPAVIDPETGQLNTINLAPGTYEYIYTVAGGFCDDDSAPVLVTIQPSPVADAGDDQVLTCAMGMVSLNGTNSTGGSNLSYAWTGPDGNPVMVDADQPMIDVAIPGIYTLTVTSNIGCTATDQVEVSADTEVPVPVLEISNISCFTEMDGTILVSGVDGGRPPYQYALNGGAYGTSNFFTGLDAGEYSVRVIDANGCFSELLLDISRPDQLSVSIDLPDEVNEYDEGDQVIVTANISGGSTINTIVWQPDSLNPGGELQSNVITLIADETRTISVTVTDENGCRASDQQTIIVRKDRPVYIPTGFSPNGDNINDILFIGANNDQVVNIQSFLVFNRWGESIFENYDFQPNDPVQGWDGTHRGEPLNPAVFVYVAVVEFENGDTVVYKGDVTLIR